METFEPEKINETSPKITIITSVFNGGKTLEDTIQSVFNQTYNNLEYIIVDGLSTDNSLEIIKKYQSQLGNNLKWISEKDEGIYDAWNKGLTMSTGDWITFVGSDDILLPEAIQSYVNNIKQKINVNYISSQILLVKSNLKPIKVIGDPWSDKMRSYCCIAHVGSLHHRSLFDQNGLFDKTYKITGDYDFLLRCFHIIIPNFIPVITAKVRDGGISKRHIFRIAKETRRAKLLNKMKSKLQCQVDYWISIIKYFVRVIINIIIKK